MENILRRILKPFAVTKIFTNFIQPEVALDTAQKDAAERMAEKLMSNQKVHDVVEDMYYEKVHKRNT